jgi:hypothetical protein
VVCSNGKIEKFIYTDSNHCTPSNHPYGDELVLEKHSDSNRYYLNNSSLHFWRVGKSKKEQPTPMPTEITAFADVNGDGKADMIIASKSQAVIVRLSTGMGC